LAVSIGVFNQLTGINAILYYINDIFRAAGFSALSANIQSVCVGTTLLVFTFLGTVLIDHLGRKKLLMIGSVGTSASLFSIAAIFVMKEHQQLLLGLLVCYIAFFALSQGAVIWVYISEVFPNHIRAKGQSLGSFSHWIMNAIISGIFPAMASSSTGYTFAFFAFMMIVQFVVVLTIYPETKGVRLEQMERKFGME
jgi:MFS family permease